MLCHHALRGYARGKAWRGAAGRMSGVVRPRIGVGAVAKRADRVRPRAMSSAPASVPPLKRLQELANLDPDVVHRVGRTLNGSTLASLGRAVELEAQALHNVKPVPPTRRQLVLVAFAPMPLFIVFGIIDNAVMILAGESFDRTLGVAFGISTMAAAALGNLVSDVAGLAVGGVVEDRFERSGFNRDPGLSRAQESLSIVRRWRFAGNAVGVSIGCIIGMFPLLFMNPEKLAQLKRKSALDSLLSAVMEFVGEALNAEMASLYVVDREKGEIWTQTSVGERGSHSTLEDKLDQRVRFPIGVGVVGHCAKTGNIVNTNDPEDLSRFGSRSNAVSGKLNRNVLCIPIFSAEGDVIGVLQVANRKSEGDQKGPFRVKDEVALTAMSSHISCALEKALESGDEHESEKTEKRAILRALKASFEHHNHHLRYATSRARERKMLGLDHELTSEDQR